MKIIYRNAKRWVAENMFGFELDEDFQLGFEYGIMHGEEQAANRLVAQILDEEEKAKPSKSRIKYLQEAVEYLRSEK